MGRERWLSLVCIVASLVISSAISGCQQKMASQPSYRPLVRSRFFADGRASRPLVAGTVARGTLETNPALTSGRKIGGVSAAPPAESGSPSPPTAGIRPDEFVAEFPFPITASILARGQDQYTVYCSVCHDTNGDGNGKVVRRGFTKPPSYIADNSRQLARSGFQVPLREAPVGYLFDVATNGFGAMADYSMQVSPRDRWAIAAYIRTMQRSQNMRLDELPPKLREEATKALGGTAP
jgi:mono/diheme cytochrome c family protein